MFNTKSFQSQSLPRLHKKRSVITLVIFVLVLGLNLYPGNIGPIQSQQVFAESCDLDLRYTLGYIPRSLSGADGGIADQEQWQNCMIASIAAAEETGAAVYDECMAFAPQPSTVEDINRCRDIANKYQREILDWLTCKCGDSGTCGEMPVGPVFN